MKGRKKAYNHPVSRHITLESWVDTLMDDCKNINLRPSDIIEAGVISLLKTGTKQTLPIMKAFLEVLDSRIEELTDIAEFYRKQVKTLENLPEKESPIVQSSPATSEKWYDNFHSVRLVGNEKIFLLAKSAYNENPNLFENLDDDTEINWSDLEKFYAIDAVMKAYGNNKTSQDVTV